MQQPLGWSWARSEYPPSMGAAEEPPKGLGGLGAAQHCRKHKQQPHQEPLLGRFILPYIPLPVHFFLLSGYQKHLSYATTREGQGEGTELPRSRGSLPQ